ncbi:helix-turn-helix domain-containing protein [Tepidibacter formicigenes]|jgi:transcriptional regulator with XRE-family HTH domain|uniref:Helix-turn-helix n=1 Tax=Tepidibacter formicigenes DSM 15518 TaxID=1123349 RepID=A0A1M6SME7_9FIRM|nr:helix-turn-helix transcriptional regulator [Tepidibacter formicigenes]SHK45807.1 Helix-turn-helix [Tepidibacter formicigenes DSM 15518]
MLKENLKRIRKLKNISQRELAEQAKVTPAYIALIETGDRKNPSLEVLQSIAQALEVDIFQLLE